MKLKYGVLAAYSSHEKEVLHGYLTILLDADEPMALLASLKRIAERKAFSVTTGRIDEEAAERWQRMASALDKVEKEIGRSHEGVKIHAI